MSTQSWNIKRELTHENVLLSFDVASVDIKHCRRYILDNCRKSREEFGFEIASIMNSISFLISEDAEILEPGIEFIDAATHMVRHSLRAEAGQPKRSDERAEGEGVTFPPFIRIGAKFTANTGVMIR